MALKLSMTCALYDRSQPLIDGRIKPRDIDLEIARLKLASMDIRIDELTTQQESYLASWRHGT